MFLRCLSVASAFLLSLLCLAEEPKNVEVTYVYSMEDAVQLAKDEGRPIYVVFKGKNCVWCERQFQEMVNPEAIGAMLGFVVFIADASENKELARRYGVRSIPDHRILDSEGKSIKSSVGYMDSKQMADFLAR